MAKHLRLSERIAQRVAKIKPSKKAQNKANFMANKAEIAEALADGWSMRLIWDTLHSENKITVTYQAFARQVNNLLPGGRKATIGSSEQQQASKANIVTPALNEPDKSGTSNKEPVIAKTQSPTFSYNPNPSEESLI